MSGRTNIREVFGTRLLVSDGATGTVLDGLLALEPAGAASAIATTDGGGLVREFLPLTRPDLIGQVHADYLAAGVDLVKTATFNANCLSLAELPGTLVACGAATIQDAAIKLNRAAASLARRAADRAASGGAVPRWVAGSVGPGTKAPSLGAIHYRDLVAAYLPQMLGLIDGGADLVLVETVQDALQAKAAIEALAEANRRRGADLPFIVSATVDGSGRLLTGSSIEAFAGALEPFRPLAIGLNCSGGPVELAAAFRRLAAVCAAPLSIMPNAGLPVVVDGGISWPLAAAEFARLTAGMALENGAALAGGCCGTNPGIIASLIAALRADARSARVPARPARCLVLCSAFNRFQAAVPALASGSPAAQLDAGLLIIDERSNASGSVKFRKLLKERGLPAAMDFIRERSARPAAGRPVAGVDICVAGSVVDEPAAFEAIARELATLLPSAISLDSLDNDSLARALPYIGGRPLINSVNLEKPAEAGRRFALARQYGAAVVCLCLDERGPARTAADKLGIAGRLYAMALAAGLAAEDLFFDPCTFPVATGNAEFADSAQETLKAISRLPEVCPGSGSILGVGNVSFGLPKELRPAFTLCFLEKARAAGLSAAIVDPLVLEQRPDAAFRALAAAVIENSAVVSGSTAALDRLLLSGQAAGGAGGAGGGDAGGSPSTSLDSLRPEDALTAAVVGGLRQAVQPQLERALAAGLDAASLSAVLATAMNEVGRRYDAGECPLPLVLRSADCARAAFASLRSLRPTAAAGQSEDHRAVIVLATVRGDLHDIGKNLVGMVLESAGYEVVDLGTDVDAPRIVAAARQHGAPVVAVSGLLTKSLQEMAAVAAALEAAGLNSYLLCGGAAVQAAYVRDQVAVCHQGLAGYARDPFQALQVLKGLSGASTADPVTSDAASVPVAETPALAGATASRGRRSPVLPTEPAFTPPFSGSRDLPPLSLAELLPQLDTASLLHVRWGYRRDQQREAQAALSVAVERLSAAGGVEANGRYGFWPVRRPDGSGIFFVTPGGERYLPLPRQAGPGGLSLADYYAALDQAALLALTLGPGAVNYLRAAHAAGDSAAYLRAHGLLAALTEAAAELGHRRVLAELGASLPAGKRYSFGFPGCPGVEYNQLVLGLLDTGRIGLRATATHQLDPEFSITALLVPRAGAVYFSV